MSGLKLTLEETNSKAQYDKKVKTILSFKHVLVQIFADTVSKLKGLKPDASVPLIEGKTAVGTKNHYTNMVNSKLITEINIEMKFIFVWKGI